MNVNEPRDIYQRVHYFEKIIFLFLFGVILTLTLYLLYQNYTIKTLKSQHQSEIEKIKDEKRKIIEDKQATIFELLDVNEKKQEEIKVVEAKIDSLSNLKAQILIIHDSKLEDIKNFSNDELVSYWKQELNN